MAYSYYASITVDNTKVSGSSNLTNFPIYVYGTYDGTGGEADLRTAANGGKIQNTASGGVTGSLTVPADLVFSPNTDGSTPYDFEVIKYDATTGEIGVWVKIPTLDYNDDTVLYVVYGDSSVSTSQENINSVWSSVYESVYHFANSSPKDSAGRWDLTAQGSVAYTTGGYGGCGGTDLSGGGSDYFNNTTTNVHKWPVNSPIYFEAWINMDSISAQQDLFAGGLGGTQTYVAASVRPTTGKIGCNVRNEAWILSNTGVSLNTWAHIGYSFDGTTTVNFWKDGATDGSPAENSVTATDTTTVFEIGGNAIGRHIFDGTICEVRLAQSHLGTDWAITSYNSMNSPSTFYTMGSEQGSAPAPAATSPTGFMTTNSKMWGV